LLATGQRLLRRQLIDAATGNHIWADRYDGELTDVFALQDEITRKVVAAIEPKLLEAESIRSQNRSPDDLGAWEMVVQAKSLFWRVNRTDGEAAIRMLKRAVERYPDYGPAHSMLAFMLLLSRLLSRPSIHTKIGRNRERQIITSKRDPSTISRRSGSRYCAERRREARA
jgi:hypothetical protein